MNSTSCPVMSNSRITEVTWTKCHDKTDIILKNTHQYVLHAHKMLIRVGVDSSLGNIKNCMQYNCYFKS